MKIIECPRDAMQGIHQFIPTEKKIAYINQLLKVGFDTIDFGSFVSPKAIPQMRDTAEVVSQINWQETETKLLAIVANTRGAEEAASHGAITYLGFPLSISETFQKRNTNKSIAEALSSLEEIQQICMNNNKILVTYISMGFGNPYGDPFSVDHVRGFVDILATMGVTIISLADTIGVSTRDNILYLFENLTRDFPQLELGAHLHSNPNSAKEKVLAAVEAGCRRFDGALLGYGGCPMAADDLVGNIATEKILEVLQENQQPASLNWGAFEESKRLASEIFNSH